MAFYKDILGLIRNGVGEGLCSSVLLQASRWKWVANQQQAWRRTALLGAQPGAPLLQPWLEGGRGLWRREVPSWC